MEQIKLFYAYELQEDDGDIKKLENKINKWLAKNPQIEVKQRIHTFHDEELIIAIYYDTERGMELL